MNRQSFIFVFFIAILVFEVSGCTFFKGNNKIPDIMIEDFDVFENGHIPSKKLCSIEGWKSSAEFVDFLSKKYPDNWYRPHPITFAPSYEIISKNTKIWVLDFGLVVSATSVKGNEVFVHEFKMGDAEEIVLFACKKTSNANR